MTLSAISSASAFDHLEIYLLVARTDVGVTLYSSSPKEISKGISMGSAAPSPHIPTVIPAFFASDIIYFIDLKTDGLKGE